MRRYGILIIGHGSRSAEWVRLVDEAAAAVRVPEGVPVVCAFLEIVEGRLIQDGIDALERQGVTDIVAVPLFISSGSTHIDEIAYALGAKDEPLLPTDLPRMRIKARLHMADPIGDDPNIAAILYEKIRGLSERPDREIVLLVGHGSVEPGFHERWQDGLSRLAERVRALGGFAEADTAMLLPDQAAEKLQEWKTRKPDHAVLVAPLFLSEGYFTKQVIPSRLQGRDYRYNGKALLPHPGVARWIERQIAPYLDGDGRPILENG